MSQTLKSQPFNKSGPELCSFFFDFNFASKDDGGVTVTVKLKCPLAPSASIKYRTTAHSRRERQETPKKKKRGYRKTIFLDHVIKQTILGDIIHQVQRCKGKCNRLREPLGQRNFINKRCDAYPEAPRETKVCQARQFTQFAGS
jgi:hypothetical protein